MIDAYLEISPMFEHNWTGIPVVTSEIARLALADEAVEWRFLYENIVIERRVVYDMLQLRTGGGHLAYLEQQLWNNRTLSNKDMGRGACIFPNVKAIRRHFAKEALIVHDFSTLLTPEFHNTDTVKHHANRVKMDVDTSDAFFCVSHATATDLIAYFNVSPDAVSIVPLGVSIDPALLSTLLARRSMTKVEPYVCVLGTIEPRKNGIAVLNMLRERPDFAERFKIVFIGRDGWSDQKNELLANLQEIGIDPGRIIFTGFVSEEVKFSLLLGSTFCIYPSFFEGFGIPIAEAAALGKFIVCSNSSSMPEVDPTMSFFFDPLDQFSLIEAFSRAEVAARESRLNEVGFSELWPRVEARGWKPAYDCIRNWLLMGDNR